MAETVAAPATSSATTPETEPEIVAAIASAEGQPAAPADSGIHVTRSLGIALLGASLAVGYAACRAWRRA